MLVSMVHPAQRSEATAIVVQTQICQAVSSLHVRAHNKLHRDTPPMFAATAYFTSISEQVLQAAVSAHSQCLASGGLAVPTVFAALIAKLCVCGGARELASQWVRRVVQCQTSGNNTEIEALAHLFAEIPKVAVESLLVPMLRTLKTTGSAKQNEPDLLWIIMSKRILTCAHLQFLLTKKITGWHLLSAAAVRQVLQALAKHDQVPTSNRLNSTLLVDGILSHAASIWAHPTFAKDTDYRRQEYVSTILLVALTGRDDVLETGVLDAPTDDPEEVEKQKQSLLSHRFVGSSFLPSFLPFFCLSSFPSFPSFLPLI
jgi:hypothetical protein